MGYCLNGCPTGGVPMYLIEPLIKYAKVSTFVETGTAGGLSIREAAKHFRQCHTIEIIPNRAIVDESIKNIVWHEGNSIDILPGIVDDLITEKSQLPKTDPPTYNYAVFFLDAHYSDPKPNTSIYKECYLLEELTILHRYQHDAIIIIDDARLFFGHPPAPNNPKDWPTIRQIFALLEEKFPYNTTSIRDDYIISYPDRLDEPFDAEWVSRYSIRYPTESDKLKTEVKSVYEAFKKYIDV